MGPLPQRLRDIRIDGQSRAHLDIIASSSQTSSASRLLLGLAFGPGWSLATLAGAAQGSILIEDFARQPVVATGWPEGWSLIAVAAPPAVAAFRLFVRAAFFSPAIRLRRKVCEAGSP